MRIFTFRVIIEPDENNSFHGFAPALRGCHTWGKTIDETKKNLREAIKCHIQGLLKDRLPVPRENENIELIQTFTEKEICQTA